MDAHEPPSKIRSVNQSSRNVRRAVSGDRSQQNWLIERFTPLLLAQAEYRLSTRTRRHLDPEDLVQETWALALPKFSHLTPNGASRMTPVLVKYVSQTLRHLCLNANRRITPGSGSVNDIPEATRGVVTRVFQQEANSKLLSTIRKLPETDRVIIILRGIEQLKPTEIGLMVNMTPNTVSQRYRRTLDRLMKELEDSGLELLPKE